MLWNVIKLYFHRLQNIDSKWKLWERNNFTKRITYLLFELYCICCNIKIRDKAIHGDNVYLRHLGSVSGYSYIGGILLQCWAERLQSPENYKACPLSALGFKIFKNGTIGILFLNFNLSCPIISRHLFKNKISVVFFRILLARVNELY